MAACGGAVEFVMTGDTVPESGLQMFVSSNDLEETVSIKSASTISLQMRQKPQALLPTLINCS